MATLEERVALLEAKLSPLSDSILVHGIMQARTERNLADVSDRMKELPRIKEFYSRIRWTFSMHWKVCA